MNDHQCPVCKSNDVTGGSFECDAGFVWQEMDCECGAEWQNTYMFVNCENIESPETVS